MTQLSDNTEQEIKRDGKSSLVTYDQRHQFVDLVIKARLNESQRQIAAIQKVTITHTTAVYRSSHAN